MGFINQLITGGHHSDRLVDDNYIDSGLVDVDKWDLIDDNYISHRIHVCHIW